MIMAETKRIIAIKNTDRICPKCSKKIRFFQKNILYGSCRYHAKCDPSNNLEIPSSPLKDRVFTVRDIPFNYSITLHKMINEDESKQMDFDYFIKKVSEYRNDIKIKKVNHVLERSRKYKQLDLSFVVGSEKVSFLLTFFNDHEGYVIQGARCIVMRYIDRFLCDIFKEDGYYFHHHPPYRSKIREFIRKFPFHGNIRVLTKDSIKLVEKIKDVGINTPILSALLDFDGKLIRKEGSEMLIREPFSPIGIIPFIDKLRILYEK
jgi:hypothetical protein